jgi:uncharacterized protein YdhG (YjbR/CyaY superfamily)
MSGRGVQERRAASRYVVAKDVDAYLRALPADQRTALEALRTAIRAACPDALEGIAYGMPAFKYMGKPLVYIGAAKAHLGLYGSNARFLSKAELQGLDHSKGTIRFTPDAPLPAALVAKVVRSRMAEIDRKA